ncbi:MAG: hypothetical protein ACQSGP_23900 [Frankia sp.]
MTTPTHVPPQVSTTPKTVTVAIFGPTGPWGRSEATAETDGQPSATGSTIRARPAHSTVQTDATNLA